MNYIDYLKHASKDFLGTFFAELAETMFYWCAITYLSIYLYNGGDLLFYFVIGILTAFVCRKGFTRTKALVNVTVILSVIAQDALWYYSQNKDTRELLDIGFEIYLEDKDENDYLKPGVYLNTDVNRILEIMWEDEEKNGKYERNGE